jgi:hypothetical protein
MFTKYDEEIENNKQNKKNAILSILSESASSFVLKCEIWSDIPTLEIWMYLGLHTWRIFVILINKDTLVKSH